MDEHAAGACVHTHASVCVRVCVSVAVPCLSVHARLSACAVLRSVSVVCVTLLLLLLLLLKEENFLLLQRRELLLQRRELLLQRRELLLEVLTHSSVVSTSTSEEGMIDLSPFLIAAISTSIAAILPATEAISLLNEEDADADDAAFVVVVVVVVVVVRCCRCCCSTPLQPLQSLLLLSLR